MTTRRYKSRLLPLLIAAVLAAGAAQAATPPPPPKTPMTAAQQEAARAEIDRLTARIEELAEQLGDDHDVHVFIRRGMDGHDMHEMHGMHDMREMHGMPGMGDMHRMHEDMFGRPGLGVVLAANTASKGVKIAAVSPDSPAMKAGLHSGDVLLSIDGKGIAGSGNDAVESARGMLADLKQGQVVRLGYARAGKTGTANVTADNISRMMMFNRGGMDAMSAMPGDMHERMAEDMVHGMPLPPNIEMEIRRAGPMQHCPPGKDDCSMPGLYEAFRWQGLNFASVDASLGRYFGANKGVLVLSTGPELAGLQAGDVIQRVEGKDVDSPRDVMRALRDKDVGSQLKLDVLRDHKPVAVAITVPDAKPLPFMMPPPPPSAPPAPLPPPSMRAPPVPAAPAAPQPPPPPPPPMTPEV